MWIDKALPYGADILLSAYAVYLFFYYFDIFFARKKSKKLWVAGLTEFVLWQFGISTIIQCHLVSDKVGNFHGNKALVTFL